MLGASGGSPEETSSATVGGMVACGVASPPVGSDAVERTVGDTVARNTSEYLELVINKCSLTDEYKDKGGGANWYRTRARYILRRSGMLQGMGCGAAFRRRARGCRSPHRTPQHSSSIAPGYVHESSRSDVSCGPSQPASFDDRNIEWP